MIKSLYRPIDSAILIYFRIVAGILMSQELINALFINKFHEYTSPKFHFSYMYFEWLKPWPYWGMVIHFALTIFAGFAVAFNFHYKIFSVLLFLGYSSLFLMEQAEYINHTYLYCLISFWMIFLPLHKKDNTQPAWMLYLLLFHMALAYFFGGIAKLNSDWLSGTPMDLYLAHRKDHLLGFIYEMKLAPYIFSYGGLIFDLLIVPMMVFRRTRRMGLIFSIIFHLSNVLMFGLATFPWFSLLLTSMFFNPSWPRKIPILRNYLPWNIQRAPEYNVNPFVVSALSIYVLIHLALPFRHLMYPGDPSWTEQGHMFAWRMMLRNKSGQVHFFVQNKTTHQLKLIDHKHFLTQRQYQKMIGKPDMILQFAHFLKETYQNEWMTDVAVFSSSRVSLNGRPMVEMIKPGTDLTQMKRTIENYEWVRPIMTRNIADSE